MCVCVSVCACLHTCTCHHIHAKSEAHFQEPILNPFLSSCQAGCPLFLPYGVLQASWLQDIWVIFFILLPGLLPQSRCDRCHHI